jgi:hypothetical protein
MAVADTLAYFDTATITAVKIKEKSTRSGNFKITLFTL